MIITRSPWAVCGRAGWDGGHISSTLLLTFLSAVEVGCVDEAK